MESHNYPTPYELREVLGSIASRAFLNSLAQKKGIFITNITHERLAAEISDIFLDDEDLEFIRSEAYQISTNHVLSGFLVNSLNSKFDLKEVYENLFVEGEGRAGQILNALVKIQSDRPTYRGALEYNKKRPGRIQFLQDEVSAFNFYLIDLGEGAWQVEIDGNRSTDLGELQSLLSKGLKREEFSELDQKNLSTEKSIEFFDELAKKGMSEDWLFVDIKHLTLRMGQDGDSEGNDENSEVAEVNQEQLVGITKAILQGRNLRDNAFVMQSVASGYRFNAMTYEYSHKTEPYSISIKAEFKGRPKVFEVSILSTYQNVGVGGRKETFLLPVGENRRIRSEFWNNSKHCYNKLI